MINYSITESLSKSVEYRPNKNPDNTFIENLITILTDNPAVDYANLTAQILTFNWKFIGITIDVLAKFLNP